MSASSTDGRGASCSAGIVAGFVLGMALAIVVMHNLVLGAGVGMSMSAKVPMTEHPASVAPVVPFEAEMPSDGGGSASAEKGAIPTAESSMTGCSNHPCVATRSDPAVAPVALPTIVAVAERSAPRPMLQVAYWPGHQTSRAPPRAGPRSSLCVWRV